MTASEQPAQPPLEGGFRTEAERQVGPRIEAIFNACSDPLTAKLDSFPKYVRRQSLTRFLALYEIFKLALDVKGSVVECGVFRGAGLMSWAKFSAILEPANLTRRIYGFDSFQGFPAISPTDTASAASKGVAAGGLASASDAELSELIAVFDSDRFLGHVGKVQLIQGDAVETIPRFLNENAHLLVSLLFMDFDLYEPTKTALRAFLPRMPKGAVLAFDELDNPLWPGETQAMLDEVGAGRLRIRRLHFDPYIGYAVLE
jgi:hypothetical protein